MVQKQRSKNKKETYVIEIGPIFREALNQQRKSIAAQTRGIDDGSDYKAAELIGKKFLDLE